MRGGERRESTLLKGTPRRTLMSSRGKVRAAKGRGNEVARASLYTTVLYGFVYPFCAMEVPLHLYLRGGGRVKLTRG